jgi:NADH:ubiquinone oxidoreductase subunit E
MVVKVCVGSACYVKGSHKVISELMTLIEANNLTEKIELKAAFCLSNCTNAVSVSIDDREIFGVDSENVEEFFYKAIKENIDLCK